MRKKQLGVVCIKVTVQGKEGDKSTDGIVFMIKKQRTENGALEHRGKRYTRTRKCY